MAFLSMAIEFAVLPVVVWPLPDAAADGVQPVSGLLLAGADVCAVADVTANEAARHATIRRVFIRDSIHEAWRIHLCQRPAGGVGSWL
jgi:hypothetical protein